MVEVTDFPIKYHSHGWGAHNQTGRTEVWAAWSVERLFVTGFVKTAKISKFIKASANESRGSVLQNERALPADHDGMLRSPGGSSPPD